MDAEVSQDKKPRSRRSAGKATAQPRTLDDLAALDVAQLEALYRTGKVPENLGVLAGHPQSRMLAIRGLDHGRLAHGIRRLAAASFFPWAGKSFTPTGEGQGEGINRVRLAGQRRWFPFKTREAESVIDGKPCILLDYEQPENPKPIRMIHDELRQVGPGLFLGPAMVKAGRDKPVLVLFFACHLGD